MSTAPGTPALAVGDPSRRRIGLAAVMALWTAAGFVIYLWVAKEIRLLYVHEPWQDDPYDAVVSFAFFFVPILAALCLTRAALCKSAEPLPVRRARELLIGSRLMLAVAGVTLGAEWMSFALGVERELWDSTTVVMLVALGFMTVGVLVAGLLVIGALRSTPAAKRGPDWWSDASAVIDEYWRPNLPLGAVLPRFAKWVIDHAAVAARGWPLATAAIVSMVFGGLLATFQGLAEDGFAPPVFILYMSVAAASMFAFLVAAGAHLHLAGERQPMAGRSRRLADSGAAAAAAFAASLAFRQVLQPIVRLVPGQGIGHLLAGCLLVGVAVAIGVFAVESGLGMHRPSQIRGG
ncbi:MAG TPA: hypothetical protein VNU19_10320 [Candidatus Acidoferrum sp.]|nr:hypothetical protein [Candidatus Acidoferrum sp.]